MKILITGGAGFIGSHLCERLIKDDHRVVSIDNYSTGKVENHIDGVKYINGSTVDIFKLCDKNFDIVYHLGEYSRVEQSFFDIEKVIEYNKNGTLKVLEFCRKNNIRLIYTGSSTRFCDIGYDSSPYTWSKASNTQLINNYGKWFNIDYAIVYFYNVYGPREISEGKYATLIAKFLKMKENKETLTIVSPGTQLRNFTHIEDIINGTILVGENGYGDEYGIGCQKSYSIIDIAKMLNCKYKLIPARNGNRMSAKVMTKKTIALGWKCKNNLEDYLKGIKLNG